MTLMKHPASHPGKMFLWWWALVFGLVGGGAVYYLSMGAGQDPSQVNMIPFVLSVTTILVGICIVSATAGWWLHR